MDVSFAFEKYQLDGNIINKTLNNTYVAYYFMLLSNLTNKEEGQKIFLAVDNERNKGVLFVKLLDVFFQFIYNEEFNFCSSVIANITALKEGRVLLLDLSLFKLFLIHFDKLNNFKLINMLRLMRNCCFEFEKYKEKLFNYNCKMFDLLLKILILTNVEDKNQMQMIGMQHIDNIFFTNFNTKIFLDEMNVPFRPEEKTHINDIIIDVFLILTNLPEAVDLMKEKGLKTVLNAIKEMIGMDENIKDRLFVITNYIDN